MNRVLIIGIDSADFDLIKPWIEEGKLPNLASIMKDGAHGKLKSIIPSMSPPAWTSFMTGKNPGKHGIFDFTARKPNSYEVEFINARWRKTSTIWKIMSDTGKRVCVLSVPVTYPPEKINGVMISGIDTLGATGGTLDPSAIHPPELYQEISFNISIAFILTLYIFEPATHRPLFSVKYLLFEILSYLDFPFKYLKRLARDSSTKLHRAYGQSQKFLYVMAVPLAIVLFVISDRIVLIFFGEAYREASVALKILSPVVLLISPPRHQFMVISLLQWDVRGSIRNKDGVVRPLLLLLLLLLLPPYYYATANFCSF